MPVKTPVDDIAEQEVEEAAAEVEAPSTTADPSPYHIQDEGVNPVVSPGPIDPSGRGIVPAGPVAAELEAQSLVQASVAEPVAAPAAPARVAFSPAAVTDWIAAHKREVLIFVGVLAAIWFLTDKSGGE